jgi:hypothetical protein
MISNKIKFPACKLKLGLLYENHELVKLYYSFRTFAAILDVILQYMLYVCVCVCVETEFCTTSWLKHVTDMLAALSNAHTY